MPAACEATGADDLASRLAASNVNPQTFLATDYLNHFNEVVMLLELVAEAPELIDELVAWHPRSYPEHFAASALADRDLAIAAYQAAPACYRRPFDATVTAMNARVLDAVGRLTAQIEAGDAAARDLAAVVVADLRRLIDCASAIIHGSVGTLEQDEIDALLEGGGGASATPPAAGAQDAIDALFD